MRNLILPFFLSFLLNTPFFAQTGCPGCVVDLPEGMPADTLFLGTAAEGQVGVAYDSDLSFRLPITTTTVAEIDSTVPAGFGINQIVINGLSNLPPGLSWESSQTTFVPADLNDGCVKICGTPQQPGLYYVQVGITAQIFVLSQQSNFSFPIYIAPAVSYTDGFSMENSSGCGSTTVSFENNIPSNGAEGFSYHWNFGNGVTSLDENPVPQTYTTAGNHEVTYEAIIDTAGYFLTSITVVNVGCSDIFGSVDMSAKVTAPDGTEVFISESIPETDPPVIFNLNLPIQQGNYTLEIIDADSGINGADDSCGTISFNQLSSGALVAGDLEVILNINHPVEIIRSTDTVVVFALPDVPEIIVDGTTSVCEGETVVLTTSYESGVQWYQDTLPLVGEHSATLIVSNSGNYSVIYQDENGCTATSEEVEIMIFDLPEAPELENTNNLLSVANVTVNPNVAFQWYFAGAAIADETSDIYCSDQSGVYTLEITDLNTGCMAASDIEVVNDEGFVNCVSGTDDIAVSQLNVQLYPNPATTALTIRFDLRETALVQMHLVDVLGRTVDQFSENSSSGSFEQQIEVADLVEGVYFLNMEVGAFRTTRRIVVK